MEVLWQSWKRRCHRVAGVRPHSRLEARNDLGRSVYEVGDVEIREDSSVAGIDTRSGVSTLVKCYSPVGIAGCVVAELFRQLGLFRRGNEPALAMTRVRVTRSDPFRRF